MKLILATNRGPFKPDGSAGDGGLVTSILPVARNLGPRCLWLHTGGPEGQPPAPPPREAGFLTETIPLSADEQQGYYSGLANGVLWPLFHELTARVDWRVLDNFERATSPWGIYCNVNRRLASRLAEVARRRVLSEPCVFAPQDYQLMQVPRELRTRIPGGRIGWLSYIPFPRPAVLDLLPREVHHTLLDGLLGADLLGFQAPKDAENFFASVDALGRADVRVEPGSGRIQLPGRQVKVDLFPLGIDTAQVRRLASDPATHARHAAWRQRFALPDRVRTLVNIARLDYTKGIPESLEAYARLLRSNPERVQDTALILVAPASRSDVEAYNAFARAVEAQVAAINAEFGGNPWPAICFVREKIELPDVVALCTLADVGVITPLKDGMNLVAHELVAAQHGRRRPAALVLSRHAGAARLLPDALLVDPTDPDDICQAISHALEQPDAERASRMALCQAAVEVHSTSEGCRGFFRALAPEATTASAAVRAHASQRVDPP